MARRSVLDVVDAAWQVHHDEASWVAGIVDAAAGAVDGAIGATGYALGVEGGGLSIGTWSGERAFLDIPLRAHAEIPIEAMMGAYGSSPRAEMMTTCWNAVGGLPPPLATTLRSLDLHDAFTILVPGVLGGGFHIGIALPRLRNPRGRDHAALTRRWSTVGHHVHRALRVRAAVRDGGALMNDGRPARNRQRLVDRARDLIAGDDIDDVERGHALWRALLAGRYSLVRWGGGGRLIAVENPPEDDVRALSVLERGVLERAARGESNKLIAYDLGLHSSSVANILERALRRLGLRDRREAARLITALLHAR